MTAAIHELSDTTSTFGALSQIFVAVILCALMSAQDCRAGELTKALGTARVFGPHTLCVAQQGQTECRQVTLWGVEEFSDSSEAEQNAEKFLHSLELDKKTIECEQVEPKDSHNKFGKWTCRYASEPKRDIARLLIENGWSRVAKNIKEQPTYSSRVAPYVEAQHSAVNNNRGLWAQIVLDRESIPSLIDKKVMAVVEPLEIGLASLKTEVGQLGSNVKKLESGNAGICTFLKKFGGDSIGDFCDPKAVSGVLGGLVGAGFTGTWSYGLARRRAHKKLANAARDLVSDLKKSSFTPEEEDRSQVEGDFAQFSEHISKIRGCCSRRR